MGFDLIFDIVLGLISVSFLFFSGKGKRFSWLLLAFSLLLLAWRQYGWQQYANAGLCLFWSVPYCVFNFFHWGASNTDNDTKILSLNVLERVSYISLVISLSSFILILLNRNSLNANIFILIFDAISTGVTVASYPLLQQKKCEGWLCYVLADVMRGVLFYVGGSWVLVVLSVVYIILDMKNYISWIKIAKTGDK